VKNDITAKLRQCQIPQNVIPISIFSFRDLAKKKKNVSVMIFYEKKSSTMATNSIAKNFKKGWKNNSPQKNHKI